MASDITLAVGDGARRMTYAELAQARGISLASARRLARRHGWARQAGNDVRPRGNTHRSPGNCGIRWPRRGRDPDPWGKAYADAREAYARPWDSVGVR